MKNNSLPSTSTASAAAQERVSLRERINNWNISPTLALALIVGLVAVAGASVYFSRPAPVTAQTTGAFSPDSADKAWLRAKIQETGSDISRLSPDDRKRADEIARSMTGMGADALFHNPASVAPPDPNAMQQAASDAYRAQNH